MNDFYEAGMSVQNTQLKEKSFYENKKFIQDTFKTAEGKFDQVSFDKFYDNAASAYQTFANFQKGDLLE
jgi:hypothetical protein